MLTGQPHDPCHKTALIIGNMPLPSLCVPMLPKHETCPAFAQSMTTESTSDVLDRSPPLRLVDPNAHRTSSSKGVRLLRHTDLLDRLQDGLASPHLNLDLSKLRCDLLSQFLLSAWHWLPPLVCSTPRFSLWKRCRLRGAGHPSQSSGMSPFLNCRASMRAIAVLDGIPLSCRRPQSPQAMKRGIAPVYGIMVSP